MITSLRFTSSILYSLLLLFLFLLHIHVLLPQSIQSGIGFFRLDYLYFIVAAFVGYIYIVQQVKISAMCIHPTSGILDI